ncbi:YcaO-like family protein [Ruegeria sp. HKCCD7255]|uniref:YcaO-like family protein n=1 Tax=Ruegeria sp. HKCCD7255 TaxID=2683004 RepID=UPI001487B542|nr:YcaO-like family protein [Ruegeria sp. HKCCD7255]
MKHYLRGTHRIRPPAETVDLLRPLFPVFGITRIADVTGLDRVGLPTMVACRPNSRSMAVSQGKGVTPEAAVASAVMESIEIFHAERITQPVLHACYEDIRYSHNIVRIDDLPFNSGRSFDPYVQMLWIQMQRLEDQTGIWAPYELIHTNYTRPLPPGSGFFLSSSNGLASGNSRAEAATHGLCEVIERDAIALWTQLPWDRRDARRVDQSTIKDPDLQQILQKFAAADIELAIWDVTSDIGVPVFLTWACERGNIPALLSRPSVGAGCHPMREIALSRALTEAAQERLTLITGSRDDLQQDFYKEMPFRELIARPGQLDFTSRPSVHAPTPEDDLSWVQIRLQDAGLKDACLIDITAPYVSDHISVVRVLVPGLEGACDDDRYTPGARAASAQELMS